MADKVPPTVTIPLVNPFTDIMDEPWSAQDGVAMDLREVLIHTMRRSPVKTGEDAERSYNVVLALKESSDTLTLEEDDYDWMTDHVKAFGWVLWTPADGVYLANYLVAEKVRQNGHL